MIKKSLFPEVNVLLIEQQIQNGSLYRFALEDLGLAHIITTTNTEEALDQMYFNKPGLIVLGDEIQPRPVFDFVRDIREGKTGAPKDVPIIHVVAKSTRARIEQARDAGVTEIVAAPLSVSSLRKRVVAALSRHRDFVEAQEFKGPDRRRRVTALDGAEQRGRAGHDDHPEN